MPFLRARAATARASLSRWRELLRLLRRADGRRAGAVRALSAGLRILRGVGGERTFGRNYDAQSRLARQAGVSAGIDMALHLVARLAGDQRARDVRRYIQYDPAPPD